ncbi:hypothetical protein EU534_00525 [Candidatus Heimdallarchaeota archaeon]|nr:MAG: hypothetical protein EU534_00525 [Candidatus Heimdallarchaeota archaeon]
MNNEEKLKYLIVDSTAIIHHFILESKLKKNEFLVIPEALIKELKSFESKTVLTLIETEGKLIEASPSNESVERINEISRKTGDFAALSKIDIQVLALALDFPNSVIYSDDNAVQNVSAFMNIDIISQHFKIKNKREYYWKCGVCGEKFSSKVETCVECGSPVKRYFVRK